MEKMTRFFRTRLRSILMLLTDSIIVVSLFSLSYLVCRLDTAHTPDMGWDIYLRQLALLLPTYIVVFAAMGIYRSLWSYAQPREYLICNISSLVAGFLFFAASRLVIERSIPFYFYAMVMCTVAIGLVSSRLIYRIYRSLKSSPNNAKSKDGSRKKRVLMIGCGNACELLLSEIRNNPNSGFDPVIGVDNNEGKIGRSICGLKIVGTCADTPRLVKKYNIDLIIVAIPSASNKLRAEILDLCSTTGCEVKMLPRLADFRTDEAGCIEKLRSITPEELLGREPVSINNDSISEYVRDRVVLITGGGGSIGSELCRQIASFSPRKLIIIDIYENNAYDIQQELIRDYGSSLALEVYIASVRDREHIFRLMERLKPDIVIHAAAHKHVPLMETSPAEAVKNNILGTLNTAQATAACGAERFIMISTDKAVNPTNIMGASKRVCELIIETMNSESKTEFCAVRFGNVLGSNGSVIPLFKKQIATGGPVTVTHKDIIRYFMTIPEAVQLVLAAGSMAQGGELFVLEMGEPVKIYDLALKMIALSGLQAGRDIEIKITGLRPGEKLYEEIMTEDEGIRATSHDKIHIGRPACIDRDVLFDVINRLGSVARDDGLSADEQAALIEKLILEIVPEFNHKLNKS